MSGRGRSGGVRSRCRCGRSPPRIPRAQGSGPVRRTRGHAARASRQPARAPARGEAGIDQRQADRARRHLLLPHGIFSDGLGDRITATTRWASAKPATSLASASGRAPRPPDLRGQAGQRWQAARSSTTKRQGSSLPWSGTRGGGPEQRGEAPPGPAPGAPASWAAASAASAGSVGATVTQSSKAETITSSRAFRQMRGALVDEGDDGRVEIVLDGKHDREPRRSRRARQGVRRRGGRRAGGAGHKARVRRSGHRRTPPPGGSPAARRAARASRAAAGGPRAR
jgi:hypothetical protein